MDGLLWMRTWRPIGPRGVESKLKGLLKASQAERRGGGGGLVEKVEGEFGLREEFIPQVFWEG